VAGISCLSSFRKKWVRVHCFPLGPLLPLAPLAFIFDQVLLVTVSALMLVSFTLEGPLLPPSSASPSSSSSFIAPTTLSLFAFGFVFSWHLIWALRPSALNSFHTSPAFKPAVRNQDELLRWLLFLVLGATQWDFMKRNEVPGSCCPMGVQWSIQVNVSGIAAGWVCCVGEFGVNCIQMPDLMIRRFKSSNLGRGRSSMSAAVSSPQFTVHQLELPDLLTFQKAYQQGCRL
jgi:hypothetical protein